MRVFMQTGQTTGVAAAGATPLDQYSKTGAAEGEEAAEEEEKPERCKSTQLSESEVSALSIRDKEAVVCISLAYFF